eukprot:scaffold13105_cov89-Isochrysis_galbana.AAC.3
MLAGGGGEAEIDEEQDGVVGEEIEGYKAEAEATAGAELGRRPRVSASLRASRWAPAPGPVRHPARRGGQDDSTPARLTAWPPPPASGRRRHR